MAGIGDFRQSGQYQVNTPVADNAGGQVDSYATVLTVRGKLRRTSSSRGNNSGEIQFNATYSWQCYVQSALDISTDGRWIIDGKIFSIASYDVSDDLTPVYTFRLREVE